MRQVKMKFLVFLALLGICLHGAAGMTHSLKYFYTGSSGVPNFPEFVAVGLVDEVQMIHYDSNTMKAEPKQDWVNKAADPQYWERNTGNFMGSQQVFKAGIDILKPRFNQTGGKHVYQVMYGCEWDDETGEVKGSFQYGYDGEDFIAFDLKEETWVAAKQQAFLTKNKWTNQAEIAQRKNYLAQICPDWLKKYLDYGRSSLLRKDLPSVSLLQKIPSSPVSCHATGFYPERATMFWRKDREELHEDVDHREILPNNDGSFQMSVDLNPPSEDWEKYECVFQLAGVNKDIVTKLDKAKIRTNEGNLITIIVIAAVVVLALVAITVLGFFIYKKNKDKRPPSPVSNPEVLEELNPKA